MKLIKISTIIIFLGFSKIFAQGDTTKHNLDTLIVHLTNQEEKIGQLELLISELKDNSYDLEKLKIEKNFFTDIIKCQTGIFASITAGFFLLFSLITYCRFKGEIKGLDKKYKKRTNKLENKVSNFFILAKGLEKETYLTQGNIAVLVSNFYLQNNKEFEFFYKLQAAASFTKMELLNDEDNRNHETINSNLIKSLDIFKEISLLSDINILNTICEKKEQIDEYINLIEKFPNCKIKDEVAELRIVLKNYINKNTSYLYE